MRKILFIYMAIIAFCTSCLDDESNMDIKELNPIRIENIDLRNNHYSLFMGDTLRIEPLVFCEGISDSKLSYEWYLAGGTLVPQVIDSTMYLCAPINAAPYSSGGGYLLRFTVKDETTGISRIETFHVEVLSPYGEGILIADTKDGVNSDISLVMSREVSSQIPRDNAKIHIFRDLWSKNNGAPLSGLVLDAVTSIYGTNRSLTVLTTEHIQRADNIDFINIPHEMDEKLFGLVVPPHIGHGYTSGKFAIHSGTGSELMSANGKITPRSVQHNNRNFAYTMYPSKVNDYNVTMMYAPMYYPIYAYDEMGKRMLFFDYANGWTAKEQNASNKFDVNDLSDYEPFCIGEISSGVSMLVKQKSSSEYKVLVMNKERNNTADYSKAIFDFTSAIDVDKAKYFDLNQKEDVVYYATDTKVYTTPLANINATVQWKVPEGSEDKITGIQIYKDYSGQIRHGQEIDGEMKDIFWGSYNSMLMISTYNEIKKEGKVTLVPIITFGVGGLEQNSEYHVELTGFGKILGIYKQKK